MTLLYLTADKIGQQSGGGLVTSQELTALQSLGNVVALSVDRPGLDPFKQDEEILGKVKALKGSPRLAHCYSGCLSETVQYLKARGCKVAYTVAAHDKEVSRKEHLRFGASFPYPHLVEKPLWEKYIEGYYHADVVVTPSKHGLECVRGYGKGWADKRVEIIPHGVDIPEKVTPLPRRFVCGYLGAIGFDKGLVYLLRAWKKLNYSDALLVLAGRDTTHPWLQEMVAREGGGAIQLAGWQNEVGSFYNQTTCYIQPSATEGFGIEVLEAMAHARPVLCSKGAGACDVVTADCGSAFPACDPNALVEFIQEAKTKWPLGAMGAAGRKQAAKYSWPLIRQRYVDLWRSLLES